MVRRNFEKRGSAKMTQLMQDVRKNLNQKPTWMEDDVWAQLQAHWESSSFKNKSEINKRNRKSMDGASLHTGGSIPHRLHWKRMVSFIYYYILVLAKFISTFITEGGKRDRSIIG